MSRGCRLDTCSYKTPSQCVVYTADLVEGSYLELNDCSETTLNDIMIQVDELLKTLMDNDGILKIDLRSNNCSFTHISALTDAATGLKINTADTIIAMLKTMCELQVRIADLETADIFDILLPQEIQLLLLTKTGCFDPDPCYPSTLTLKDLLIKIINKICP